MYFKITEISNEYKIFSTVMSNINIATYEQNLKNNRSFNSHNNFQENSRRNFPSSNSLKPPIFVEFYDRLSQFFNLCP